MAIPLHEGAIGPPNMSKRAVIAGLIAFFATGADVSAADESSLPKGWTPGPISASLAGQATIDVPVGYYFLDAAATRKLLQTHQRIRRGNELGSILRGGASGSWFAVFTYANTGHVDDGEKDALDAGTLLSTLEEGNQRANSQRAKQGRPALSIDGWHRPPAYGGSMNRLTWSTRLVGGENVLIDQAVRWLGRDAVIGAHLVTDADSALLSAAQFAEIAASYSFNEGSRYADFRPGERSAPHGLAALIAEGNAPVDDESSMFPGLWSGIVLGVLAALGGAGLWVRGRMQPEPPIETSSVESELKQLEEIDPTLA